MSYLYSEEEITYDEFLKIQEKCEDRLEYNNGKITLMSPTTIKHNKIVTNITFELKKYFKGTKCDVFSEQIAVVFENETEKNEFLPDIFVVCEDAKTRGEKFITPPKTIFEVASKRYASNDYFIKSEIYQRFGVLEYNIVEQSGHIVQYKLEDGMYHINNTYHLGDVFKSSIFDNLSFELNEIF